MKEPWNFSRTMNQSFPGRASSPAVILALLSLLWATRLLPAERLTYGETSLAYARMGGRMGGYFGEGVGFTQMDGRFLWSGLFWEWGGGCIFGVGDTTIVYPGEGSWTGTEMGVFIPLSLGLKYYPGFEWSGVSPHVCVGLGLPVFIRLHASWREDFEGSWFLGKNLHVGGGLDYHLSERWFLGAKAVYYIDSWPSRTGGGNPGGGFGGNVLAVSLSLTHWSKD